ncbi:MAG: tetratricopeptide repeat protein, partial [Planctomycetota bacterium]
MNETSKARSSGLDEFLAWVPLHPRFWRRQKARVHVKRGFENYVAGKSHEAVVEYGRALDYEPTWTDVLLQRAMASFRREDFKAAEQDCTRALEIRPRDADALLHRASARIALGEHDSAIEDCEQVLEDESQAPGAFVSRAVARYSRGEVDAAIEDL